ncbi:hypothetical protein CRM22_003904 [Opisthorchis felineus]|uniref:Uncharacterized protein n=1 Tax=Opisthorchis felineus TaxID=147828 RepID=A0A4S2LZJ7_OPIFE|nr:hypothetical protein CRM22_003904 [Opisthorchis felineus]
MICTINRTSLRLEHAIILVACSSDMAGRTFKYFCKISGLIHMFENDCFSLRKECIRQQKMFSEMIELPLDLSFAFYESSSTCVPECPELFDAFVANIICT